MMEYLQRLNVLQGLYAEISLQLTKELAGQADQQKIDEYHHLLRQIDVEVDRIQKMKSYTTTPPKE
jgi:hypothetical protein